ncbi:translation elongation factor Ts [Flammeovirgaceae bacterium SG7u.111]|nr:translation elongation factor Ts [Flammeovirgaceae bacterium SG7u.132]WPO36137.1 translation elongation factor Ts [Flammeovirgaceae bacterium SG7u.111]
MAITAKQVNELRQITGAGMMDCKKALVEADGDLEAAIDILRKKGQKIAAKRADREATEGIALAYTSEDGSEGLAFALNCETEPVSNIDDFRNLGNSILELATTNKPADLQALLSLPLGGKTVNEVITDLTGKVGEKIEVSKYAYMKGERVVSYLHGKSIAVLVNLENTGGADVEEAGKDVAMQIAAMKPVAVDQSGVDTSLIEKEKEIGLDKARQEGKPEHILEKIAEGFVRKFLQENTLLSQAFVKDNKQSVKQYLNSVQSGMTVKEFARISTGR